MQRQDHRALHPLLIPFLAVHGWLLFTLAGNLVYLARQRRRAAAPRVSIVVPARNEERHLPHLLASVFAQRYGDFELVVYDDGSTDGTAALLAACADPRLVMMRGAGPPEGWIGKPHALYAATRAVTGDVLLFLDADATLAHPDALQELVERHAALPASSVLTGVTSLHPSRAWLLVSLAAHSILVGLPWFLPGRFRSLGALNGQAWMIGADVYRRLEPHAAVRAEVLEDVKAGRYLRAHGVRAYAAPLANLVHVRMYDTFGEAWQGFRKNAYLMLGGRPLPFIVLMALYAGVYLAAPFFLPWLLVPVVVAKAITDRLCGLPLWVSLLAPLSHAFALALGVDSAHALSTGRVRWKGRSV